MNWKDVKGSDRCQFKVFSQHLPQRTEVNRGKLSQIGDLWAENLCTRIWRSANRNTAFVIEWMV